MPIILRVYAAEWGKDTIERLYRNIAQELKNTDDGRKTAKFISLNQSIQVGDRYADFSQQNTEGKTVRLSDMQGKLVLLEFWGSWCMPCRNLIDNKGVIIAKDLRGVALRNKLQEILK